MNAIMEIAAETLAGTTIAEAAASDPAVAAYKKWDRARETETRYLAQLEGEWTSDPVAAANEKAVDDAYWAMARTKPTTMEGLSLLMRAWAYDRTAINMGAVPADPDSWCDQLGCWHDDRDVALLLNIIGEDA